jgi:hypothetical protein
MSLTHYSTIPVFQYSLPEADERSRQTSPLCAL